MLGGRRSDLGGWQQRCAIEDDRPVAVAGWCFVGDGGVGVAFDVKTRGIYSSMLLLSGAEPGIWKKRGMKLFKKFRGA